MGLGPTHTSTISSPLLIVYKDPLSKQGHILGSGLGGRHAPYSRYSHCHQPIASEAPVIPFPPQVLSHGPLFPPRDVNNTLAAGMALPRTQQTP